MYSVTSDEVFARADLPAPMCGDPSPRVVADESHLRLCYRSSEEPAEFVVVRGSYTSLYFGNPNGEALSGHPLYARGLRSYAVFEIRNSSWIAQQKARNRVHPRHDPKMFSRYSHYVITFHDSLIEVCSSDLSWKVHPGDETEMMAAMRHPLDRP